MGIHGWRRMEACNWGSQDLRKAVAPRMMMSIRKIGNKRGNSYRKNEEVCG
jgi:hypothetical protein